MLSCFKFLILEACLAKYSTLLEVVFCGMFWARSSCSVILCSWVKMYCISINEAWGSSHFSQFYCIFLSSRLFFFFQGRSLIAFDLRLLLLYNLLLLLHTPNVCGVLLRNCEKNRATDRKTRVLSVLRLKGDLIILSVSPTLWNEVVARWGLASSLM